MSRGLASVAVLMAASVLAQPATRAQSPSQTAAPTGLIVGQVIDATTNRPVPEADVQLRIGIGQIPGDGRVIADTEGRYFFGGLAPGRYSLHASAAGYTEGAYGARRPPRLTAPASEDGLGLELRDGQRVLDATILVWKHASISGVVTDESGDPMIGIVVLTFQRVIVNGRPRFVSQGRWLSMTDDRGVYRSIGLPPGDYVVAIAVSHSTLPPTGVVSTVQSDSTRSAEFFGVPPELAMPGSFRSQRFGDQVLHTLHGLPIPNVSGDTGRLSTYQTTYAPGVTSAAEAGIVTLAAGDNRHGVSIQMRPVPAARVSGRLVGPAGSSPGSLRLMPASTGNLVAASPFHAATALSDASGQFAFLAVPPGSYVLSVVTEPKFSATPAMRQILWASQPIAVGAADLDGLIVTLRPTIPIDGRVVLARGIEIPTGSAPPSPASVSFDPVSGEPGLSVRASAKGEFSTGLIGGSYYVSAQPPPGWFVSAIAVGGRVLNESPVDVTADAVDIVITLTNAPSRVEVTVRDAPPAPDGSVRVFVFPADRSMWSDHGPASRRFQTSRGGPGGGYAFPGLPPGDYLIAAAGEEHSAEWLDPKFLEVLSRFATGVTVFEGQSLSAAVRFGVVR